MKRILIGTVASMILILVGARVSLAQEKTFTGIITDEKLNCAQEPFKGPEGPSGAIQKTACVLYWAHSATPKSKIVLYDPDTKTTYQLDDETLVMPYVGDIGKVSITGSYDETKKTIHIKDIKS